MQLQSTHGVGSLSAAAEFETTNVFAVTVVQAEREFWACLEVVMTKTKLMPEMSRHLYTVRCKQQYNEQ